MYNLPMERWLYWPTRFAFITQPFLANRQRYIKFGLAGHEGIDIRARRGTDILCCANGTVSLVGWKTPDHAYGYAVRVVHERPDGRYETIYAHGVEGSAKVKKGQTVKAGDVLMLADNTGNSAGSHLHLSLIKLKLVGENITSDPVGLESRQWFRSKYGQLFIDPQAVMFSFEETQQMLKEKQ